jgi:hypothetical protein
MPIKKSKSTKRRTTIKDLSRGKKELNREEQKKVQGGATRIVSPGIRTGTGGNAPAGGGQDSANES